MHKRFLAILAIVTTVFAFGVGSAMADHYSPANPHPGCENGKAKGCEDGTPGDSDGHDEEEPPVEEPPGEAPSVHPAPCDQLTQVPGVGGPIADGCAQVIGNLPAAPGGEEEPPVDEEPEPRPAPCDEFTAIPGIGLQVADGCAQVVGNIPAP